MKTVLLTIFTLYFLGYCLCDLSDIEIPKIDDITVIKEKCDNLGGNGTYDKLKETATSAASCLQELIDFDQVKNELEAAKKTGSMDEVFGKYCNKTSQATDCTKDFVTEIKKCLSPEEQNALNLTLDVVKKLGEFVCYRDGDRIAMFVAEGGIECISSHTEEIKNCINSTFKLDSSSVTSNSLPSLLIDEKKCSDLGTLQNCVVQDLEKCKDSTPANIVDALFRFIKKSACPKKNKRHVRKQPQV